jgi:galactokinase
MREVEARAPGRVNLIGEHTDYQEGYVMPSAVPQQTRVRVATRGDRRVRATSTEMGGGPIEYVLGEERRGRGWIDYIQGITWVLAREGIPIGGFDVDIRSDVPVGSGLSSSAALEVAMLRALRAAFDFEMSEVQLARRAQRAEVEFVGAPVGIMDQMASSLAGEREALFLDTRTLHFERIALPPALDLVVIDSGVSHQHAGGEYVTRRRESDEAARLLGVRCLRDIDPEEMGRISALPGVLARRARHIVTENRRVLDARAALLSCDLVELGRLFNASHASLRDEYEVSVPAVNLLVALAVSDRRVFGARMTGGGFGGSVVIAAGAPFGADVATRIVAAYRDRGGTATVLVPIGT